MKLKIYKILQTNINTFSIGVEKTFESTFYNYNDLSYFANGIIVFIGLAFASYKYFFGKSENSKKEALIIIISTVVGITLLNMVYWWMRTKLI